MAQQCRPRAVRHKLDRTLDGYRDRRGYELGDDEQQDDTTAKAGHCAQDRRQKRRNPN